MGLAKVVPCFGTPHAQLHSGIQFLVRFLWFQKLCIFDNPHSFTSIVGVENNDFLVPGPPPRTKGAKMRGVRVPSTSNLGSSRLL